VLRVSIEVAVLTRFDSISICEPHPPNNLEWQRQAAVVHVVLYPNVNWCSPFPTVTDHPITKTPRLQNPYNLRLQHSSCLDLTKQNYWIRNWSVFAIAWYVTVLTKSKRSDAMPVSCVTSKKTNKTNTVALRYKNTVHKNTLSIRLPTTVPTYLLCKIWVNYIVEYFSRSATFCVEIIIKSSTSAKVQIDGRLGYVHIRSL